MTLLQRIDHTTGGSAEVAAGRVRTTFAPMLDRAARRRLAVQVQALAGLPALDHVAPVLDGGVDGDGRVWLERPGPAGPTLADRVAAGVVDVEEAVGLVLPVVAGLAALHERGVVHGGVGPDAVVLAPAGPTLVDPRPPLVAERAGPPDPGLAAAEVLRGEAPGAPADVAAVAATLVLLVTGRTPWGPLGQDAEAVLLRMLSGAAPDAGPLAAWPAVSRSLAAADPADRPSAATLAAALAGDDDRLATLGPTAPVPLGPDSTVAGGTPLGSRYLLHERLGRGAMGEVFRATARDDGAEVAVKVLRPELAEDTTLVARFLAERATLVGIDHPNLVRVRDLVAEGTTLAIVMDLVDGPDLRRYLRTAPPIPPAAACRLLAQLAGALGAVHAAGVVHRDLKPENVLLERTGSADVRVRLADFGVARSSSHVTLTRMDQLIGTPEYLAPEVAAGATAGPEADVYAAGVVAYELLVGCRPFVADHPAAVLKAHAEQAPPRPPGLDDRLWGVVDACLAKDPARRPTAGALAASLAERAAALGDDPALPRLAEPPRPEAAAEELGTVAGTLPPRSRPAPAPAPASRRRRLVLAGAAVVGVAAVTGAVVASRGGGTAAGPATTTTAAPAVRSVPLVTTGDRADAHTVNLRFQPLDGAVDYVVVRDPGAGDVPLDAKPLAGASFVSVVDDANDNRHCYVVMAVVRTTATTGPAVLEPYCTT
ncbi:MAG TPA: serine/threonine-protein kinase [Acidimicrobiales bacterium]|nr:serine/threonine-protein kinase [Acidimicrobiales bacterium]